MYRPLPEFLRIDDSPIHGQGLFTTAYIAKGTNLGVGWIHYAGEKNRTPLGGFVNHSDTPNCQALISGTFMNTTEKNLYALRDIEAGEELTVEYQSYRPDLIRD